MRTLDTTTFGPRCRKALAVAMMATVAALGATGVAGCQPVDTVDASGQWVRTTEEGALTIAHRGESVKYPENTMVAFDAALAAGAELVENDVWMSSDNVPVVIHDEKVDRTTDGTGLVTSMTAAEIARLDAGSWFSPAYAGARVPTLAEQLDSIKQHPGSTLLLDVKKADREEMEIIIGQIQERDMLDQVLLQSKDKQVLVDAHAIEPDLEIGLLAPATDNALEIAARYHLDSFNPDWSSLSKNPHIIAELNAAGVGVMAWTVNDPSAWPAMDAAGVDGVITDRASEHLAYRASK